jgi:hypothetical protein
VISQRLKMLGSVELACGALGVVSSWGSWQHSTGSFSVRWPLLPVVLFPLSIVAGSLLLLDDDRGLWPTFVVQLLQVVSVNVGWLYVFLVGPLARVTVSESGLQLSLGGGGLSMLTSAAPDGTLSAQGVSVAIDVGYLPSPLRDAAWTVGVNVVPLALLWIVWAALRERRTILSAA